MKYLLLAALLISAQAKAQKTEDTKIFITVDDTAGLYNRVKIAMVKNDFIVKEDGNADTLTTYPGEMKKVRGYAIVVAVLQGNTVMLTGSYGLTKMDDFGFTRTPKSYKPIVYFKGGKGWKMLMEIAGRIGGTYTYGR